MSAPAPLDVVEQARAEMLTRRPDLDALPGDISELILFESAAAADFVLFYAMQRFSKTFLDGAQGDDLTVLVEDRYGITRHPATSAVGSVTFTAVSGPVSGSIPAGTQVATVPDATGAFQVYTTDSPLSFVSETSKSVSVTAVSPGSAGNVGPATITRSLDTLFDDFTVTNPDRLAGGNEAESDDELRARAKRFFRDQQRGTTRALVTGALQVPQVRRASVFEDSGGLVTVFVGDDEGNASAEVLFLVETELENWRAAGTVVNVSGSTPFLQNVVLTLTVRAGTAITPLINTVTTAVTNAINRLQPGETLYRSLIQSVALAVDDENIVDVVVTTPAANVQPASNQIIRAGTVSVS